jgi:hypothetical protein
MDRTRVPSSPLELKCKEMYGMAKNKAVQPNGRQEEKKYTKQIKKGMVERKKILETSFLNIQHGNYVRRRRAQV